MDFLGIVVLKSECLVRERVLDISAFACDYWPSCLFQNAWNVTIESGGGLLL